MLVEIVPIHDGSGCFEKYPVVHVYSDLRVTMVYEGISDTQRMVIAHAFGAEQRNSDQWYEMQRSTDSQLLATIVGAIGGALLTALGAYGLFFVQENAKTASVCRAFLSDIHAHLEIERERFDGLFPLFEKMKTVDSLKQEGGRDWLIVSVPDSFPILEANASNVGSLSEGIRQNVLQYYQQTAELRAHINMLGSVAILYASGGERDKAVDRYPKLYDAWRKSAIELSASLDCN